MKQQKRGARGVLLSIKFNRPYLQSLLLFILVSKQRAGYILSHIFQFPLFLIPLYITLKGRFLVFFSFVVYIN